MKILAIDPGPKESGYVQFVDGKVLESGVLPNDQMLGRLAGAYADKLALEMVASFGMAVGREVFETVRWIGRFEQRWRDTRMGEVRLVYRMEVKMHLCHSPKAKDANIRAALIDKLGAPGTKREQGPTYGVKSHAWPALGVAVVAAETPSPLQ